MVVYRGGGLVGEPLIPETLNPDTLNPDTRNSKTGSHTARYAIPASISWSIFCFIWEGVPKNRRYLELFGYPHNKDYDIYWGSPYFGKLPFQS